MKYEDFFRQQYLRTQKPNLKNDLIAKKLLLKLGVKNLPYPAIGDFSESLLYNYFYLKGTEYENKFNELLNLYHFNYSMSIHNAIYYLLATDDERVDSINPGNWPGIQEINKIDSKYNLNTVLGEIEVFKASEQYSNTHSSYIFERQLMGKCYERTYDFVKENQDYQAVLAYMPNFFCGGNYHAYLKKDNQVLDIASNALYVSEKSIDKIFNGEEIVELSYSQIEKKFRLLKHRIPKISNNSKLLTLALYYDHKNHRN